MSCAEPSTTTGRKLNCTVNKLQISTFITLSSSLIHFRGTCKGVDGLHCHCSEAESRLKWICYSGKRMWVLSIAQEISWASVKYFHPIINQGGYLIPIKVSIKPTGASAKIQCDDLKSVTSSQCIYYEWIFWMSEKYQQWNKTTNIQMEPMTQQPIKISIKLGGSPWVGCVENWRKCNISPDQDQHHNI